MKINENKTLYRCDRCKTEFWWTPALVPAELYCYSDGTPDGEYLRLHLCSRCAGNLHKIFLTPYMDNEYDLMVKTNEMLNIKVSELLEQKEAIKRAFDDYTKNHQPSKNSADLEDQLESVMKSREGILDELKSVISRLDMLKKSNAALRDANIILTSNLAEYQAKMSGLQHDPNRETAF